MYTYLKASRLAVDRYGRLKSYNAKKVTSSESNDQNVSSSAQLALEKPGKIRDNFQMTRFFSQVSFEKKKTMQNSVTILPKKTNKAEKTSLITSLFFHMNLIGNLNRKVKVARLVMCLFLTFYIFYTVFTHQWHYV